MSAPFSPDAVRVRVPATSANLGPGFDAVGLAVARHDVVTARITAGGLRIDVDGEGSEQVARDKTNLVAGAMLRGFDALGVAVPGVALECTNRIPHSRGLGSSAAAIVAGILLARGLLVDGPDRMSVTDVLALASEVEGHPDNVAACLFGGLSIAWIEDGAPRAVRRDLDPAIVPVALIPPFTSSTELARSLLPANVSHRDAAFAAGRAALLVAALTGTPQALFAATEDRLHQLYRAPAMPDSARLVGRLRSAGLPAVISGAGPTVLVLARGEVEAERIRGLTPDTWEFAALPVDTGGARFERIGADGSADVPTDGS